MPNSTFQVVIFRHATRSMTADDDPSLNSVGLLQAKRLVELIEPRGPLPLPTALWTSPKLRARQTFLPLGESCSLEPIVDPLLDERQSFETREDLQNRIRETIGKVEASAGGCLYLCSHFDWLEEAMILLPSEMSDFELALSFAPAEYRIFEIKNGLWKLKGRGHAE